MPRLGVLLRQGISSSAWAEVRSGERPKPEFAALVDNLDGLLITAASGPRILRRYPVLAAAFGAFFRRSDIDALYVASEDLGLITALLLRAVGWKRPIIVVIHAALSPKMQKALRFVGRRTFTNAIVVSEEQRRILINKCGFTDQQAVHAFNWVDTDFLSAGGTPGDFVFACGSENRDYATLFKAAVLTDKPFVICAGGFHGRDNSVAASAPSNVEIVSKHLPWIRLRDYYRSARVVVVPLNDVAYAAGVTSLVEASAVGRPTVATSSRGIAEYPAAAKVAPSDPTAIVHAIDRLWNDPETARNVGEQAMLWAKKNASLTKYVEQISRLAGYQDVAK